MAWWGHFNTVMKHKMIVMRYCFRVGLYRQGIMHDLSKFSLTEFQVGCRYYQGNRSPNNAEREDKGVSTAWLHHKGRNKHHFEYWLDYSKEKKGAIAGMRMPNRYVVEMFIDRIAACKTYEKEKYTSESPYIYYEKGKAYHLMHEEVTMLLEELLVMLSEKGEEHTLCYIKKEVL